MFDFIIVRVPITYQYSHCIIFSDDFIFFSKGWRVEVGRLWISTPVRYSCSLLFCWGKLWVSMMCTLYNKNDILLLLPSKFVLPSVEKHGCASSFFYKNIFIIENMQFPLCESLAHTYVVKANLYLREIFTITSLSSIGCNFVVPSTWRSHGR
jgi:hypothetical protein